MPSPRSAECRQGLHHRGGAPTRRRPGSTSRSSSTCASPTSTSRAPSPAPSISPGQPRVPGRGPAARQGRPGRRLLRRRGPLGLRRPDPGGARLHRRRLDHRRVQPLEGRGPAVVDAPDPDRRAAQPLPAPPAASRGRRGRPAEAPRRPRCSCSGAGGLGSPGRPLPRRGRCRHARHHRHGRGRRLQPAAPDPPQHGPDRRAQGRLGQEDAHRHQPRRQRRRPTTSASGPTTSWTSSTATTSSSTGPTTSRPATSSTTRRCSKRIPVVHGSIFRFEGQVTVFDPYDGPCYRCLIPEPPPAELAPSCAEAGRPRRAARDHRVDPGARGDQGAARPRRPAGRPAAGLRRARGDASAPSRCAATRSARPAGPTPGRIVIAEYDELCMPHARLKAPRRSGGLT